MSSIKDHLVQDEKVLIVDEFTGRAMEGRRFSEGLLLVIEAVSEEQVEKPDDSGSLTIKIILGLIKNYLA